MELLWIIPLSILIFVIMIILGVTLIGTITGNIRMVENMINFFRI